MMQVGDLNKKVGFVYSDACEKQRKLMLLGTKSFKNMITYLIFEFCQSCHSVLSETKHVSPV